MMVSCSLMVSVSELQLEVPFALVLYTGWDFPWGKV